MKTGNNILLKERIILKEQLGEHFISNMKERYDVAVKMMGIDESNLNTIYCSSLNKHTCLVTKEDKNYLVFDEHHIEVLGTLNTLYFLYGQMGLKKPFFDLARSTDNYCEKRLRTAVLLLLTENQVLNGNIRKALKYAKEIEDYAIGEGDCKGFSFALFLAKMHRMDTAQAFGLNFYVFHEMAHVKYGQSPETFSDIEGFAGSVYSLMKPLYDKMTEGKFQVSFNAQECACDVYALLTHFLFLSTHDDVENWIYAMIESYIISVTNIVIMNSVYQRADVSLDEVYIEAYIRIMLAVNTLGYFLGQFVGKDILLSLQQIMMDVRESHENYKAEIDATWNMYSDMYKDETEEPDFMSEEWNQCYEEVMDILLSLK